MFIYIICPVHHLTPEIKSSIDHYVKGLEATGATVHLPYRDTVQIAREIDACVINAAAISRADQVHIWWNPKISVASIFDLGMVWIKQLPIHLINPDDVVSNDERSIDNMVNTWCHQKWFDRSVNMEA